MIFNVKTFKMTLVSPRENSCTSVILINAQSSVCVLFVFYMTTTNTQTSTQNYNEAQTLLAPFYEAQPLPTGQARPAYTRCFNVLLM